MFESSSRFFSAEQKNKTSFFSLFCKIIIIAKFLLNNQDNELIAVACFLFQKIKILRFVFSVAAIIRWGLAICHKIRVSSLVHIDGVRIASPGSF